MIPLMLQDGYRPKGWCKSQYLYQALRLILQHRRHAVDMVHAAGSGTFAGHENVL
jgi:hypothetical protein